MKRKHSTRPSQTRNLDERSADLRLWFGDGKVGGWSARVKACREVSVGRTNSKRGLGFAVTRGAKDPAWGWEKGAQVVDFVLDKDQVAQLAAYMQNFISLLKPLGPKQTGMNLVAMTAPKLRLFMELEQAAQKAHPECREIEVDEGVVEIEGPQRKKLVDWFKKHRPKDAARIERAFTKRLWAGQP
jgi:hypothetical protein